MAITDRKETEYIAQQIRNVLSQDEEIKRTVINLIAKIMSDDKRGNTLEEIVSKCLDDEEKGTLRGNHYLMVKWIKRTSKCIFWFLVSAWIVSVVLHVFLWQSFSELKENAKDAPVAAKICETVAADGTSTNLYGVGQMNASQFTSGENRNTVVMVKQSDDNYWVEFTKLYDLLRSELGEWLTILSILIAFFGVCVPIGSQLVQSRTFSDTLNGVRDKIKEFEARLATLDVNFGAKIDTLAEMIDKGNVSASDIKASQASDDTGTTMNRGDLSIQTKDNANADKSKLGNITTGVTSNKTVSGAIDVQITTNGTAKDESNSVESKEKRNDRSNLPDPPQSEADRPVAEKDYETLLKNFDSVFTAFNYALKVEDRGFAEFLMPRLKSILPSETYVYRVLSQVASMGSDAAAEELKEVLRHINDKDCPYSLEIRVDAIGAYVSFCNRRDAENENLEFVCKLIEGILPSAQSDKKQLAQLHNQLQRLYSGAAGTLGNQGGNGADIVKMLNLAFDEIDKAIELDPEESAYKTNREVCYKMLGQLASKGIPEAYKALKDFLAGMKENGNKLSLETRVTLIGLYVNCCQQHDAENENLEFVEGLIKDILSSAQSDKKQEAQLHNQLQRLYFGAAFTLKTREGNTDQTEELLRKAVDELKTAIKLDPSKSAFSYNLAGCYKELGEIESAIAAIEGCLNRGTEDYDSYKLAYDLYRGKGNGEKSAEMARKMKKLNPYRVVVDLHEAEGGEGD